MRFTVRDKATGVKHSFDRPASTDRNKQRDERRSMAQQIKTALFPGASYRHAHKRGQIALATA